jgi:hypothetical protein
MAKRAESEGFFVFNAQNLRAGDVFLSSVPNHAVSVVVRTVTGSRFSHAAICTKPPSFLEAVGTGVRPFSALGIGVRDKGWVCVLRLRQTVENHESLAEGAGAQALRYITQGYWLSGAVATKLPGLRLRERSRLFCSHLVSRAYEEAGLHLLPGKVSSETTPEDLWRSALLIDVTDHVLMRTNENAFPFDLSFADEGSKANQIDEEMRIRRKVNDKIEDIIRKNRKDLLNESVLRGYGIKSFDKADRFHCLLVALIAAQKDSPRQAAILDQQILDVITDEGYLAIPELLCVAGTLSDEIMCVEQALAYALDRGFWDTERIGNELRYYKDTADVLKGRIPELDTFAKVHQKCFQETRLKTFRALSETYARYKRHCEEALKVLNKCVALIKTRSQWEM